MISQTGVGGAPTPKGEESGGANLLFGHFFPKTAVYRKVTVSLLLTVLLAMSLRNYSTIHPEIGKLWYRFRVSSRIRSVRIKSKSAAYHLPKCALPTTAKINIKCSRKHRLVRGTLPTTDKYLAE